MIANNSYNNFKFMGHLLDDANKKEICIYYIMQ